MSFAVNGVSFEIAKKSIGLQPEKEGLEQILSAGVLYLKTNRFKSIIIVYIHSVWKVACGTVLMGRKSEDNLVELTHFYAIPRNQTQVSRLASQVSLPIETSHQPRVSWLNVPASKPLRPAPWGRASFFCL